MLSSATTEKAAEAVISRTFLRMFFDRPATPRAGNCDERRMLAAHVSIGEPSLRRWGDSDKWVTGGHETAACPRDGSNPGLSCLPGSRHGLGKMRSLGRTTRLGSMSPQQIRSLMLTFSTNLKRLSTGANNKQQKEGAP